MICVDASVAVKWVLVEERSDQAYALYESTRAAHEAIVAPPLLPIEVTNILHRRRRRPGGPTLDEAAASLADFLAFPIVLHNPEGLHQRALALADAHGLPATYDAHYLAVAESLGCVFWTDDRRLCHALAGRLAFVRPLAEFASG